MIEFLQLDKQQFSFGFQATRIQSDNLQVNDKSFCANYYQLYWVVAGSVTIHLDSETYTVKQDECSFIGKGQVYKIQTATYFDILVIRFNESFYCRNDFDTSLLDNCLFFDNSKNLQKFTVENNLKKILKQYYNSLAFICTKPFDDLMYHFAHNTVERLLLFSQNELIHSVYNQMAVLKRPEQEIAKNFTHLLKKHAKEQRRVKFYADVLLISDKRLTEVCNKIYSQSPKKLISIQVTLEAKRLLKHTTMSIKEVAFELRFAEPSNFIRFFISCTGRSPKQYRDEHINTTIAPSEPKLIA